MKAFKSFAGDRRGNTAIIFGLSVLALVTAVGGGLDVSRMVNVRSALQDAADAAVLRAATMSSGTTTTAQTEAAHKAFNANLADDLETDVQSKVLTRNVEGSNTSLTYTVSAQVPAIFPKLIGINYFTINVLSEAKAQMRKSEIVFVLDSTGSMSSSNKMTNLKSSVDTVLASLLDDSGNNSSGTKVGVVPFNTQVRVAPGTSYTWVDWGTATSSQTCTSALSSNYCSLMHDAADKACTGATDIAACHATLKLYYKTWTSGSKTYYEVSVKAYEVTSSGYNIRTYTESNYKTSYTYTTTGGTSCNSETGVCTTTTGGSTATGTTTTFNTQSGTKTAATNLSAYNSTPSGYTSVSSSALTYTASYSNGYDGKAATTTNTTTNGVAKTIYMPAVPASRSSWTGCVIDRTQPYDVSPESPGTLAATLYPARPCASSSLLQMRALTEDVAGTRTYIKSLTPAGNTNITIGVQWGMEVLSPSDPMNGGVAFGDDVTLKYMIVVTDGDNTANRWTSNQSQIDARTKLACQAAKDKGITVFVIRVMEGNSTLLSECASKTDYYYDLTNATQLNQALKDVFEAIKKTRLTK